MDTVLGYEEPTNCWEVRRRPRSGREFEWSETDARPAGGAVCAQLIVSLTRLDLQASEKVVQHVAEHPQLLAAIHPVFRTTHPERSDCVGQEQFPVAAFGFVVGVDPDGAVVSHPGDELLVLDGDDAFKRRDFMDQRYGITNQAERFSSQGAQRLVQDEHELAFRP